MAIRTPQQFRRMVERRDELVSSAARAGMAQGLDETAELMAQTTAFRDRTGDLRRAIRDQNNRTRAGKRSVTSRLGVPIWYAAIVAAKTGFHLQAVAASEDIFERNIVGEINAALRQL